MPSELQLASSSGEVDKVTEMLAALNKDQPDHGMSKSLQKKLIKDAQIAQKKLAKGGGAAAANTQSSGAQRSTESTKATKGASLPSPPLPAPTVASAAKRPKPAARWRRLPAPSCCR